MNRVHEFLEPSLLLRSDQQIICSLVSALALPEVSAFRSSSQDHVLCLHAEIDHLHYSVAMNTYLPLGLPKFEVLAMTRRHTLSFLLL